MMLLGSGFRLPVLAAMVADIIEQAVVGHDPYDVEMLFDTVYGRASYGQAARPRAYCGILSAIEMACWDIIGKDCRQPVYELLGGPMRDRVRTYTYIYDDPASRPGDGSPLSRDVWLNPAYAACAGAGATPTSASPRSRSTRSR